MSGEQERPVAKDDPPSSQDKAKIECYICLESTGKLVRECACRGSAGFAHADCLVTAATHDKRLLQRCSMCNQSHGGELLLQLARANYESLADQPIDDAERLHAMKFLANRLGENGKMHEATQIAREVVAVTTEKHGDQHHLTTVAKGLLGYCLIGLGDFEGARLLLKEAVASARADVDELRGSSRASIAPELAKNATLHAHTLVVNLTYAVEQLGDHDQALRMREEDLVMCRREFGDDATVTHESAGYLGNLWHKLGEYAAAETLLKGTVDHFMKVMGPGHISTLQWDKSYKLALRETLVPEAIASQSVDAVDTGPCFKLKRSVCGQKRCWSLVVTKVLKKTASHPSARKLIGKGILPIQPPTGTGTLRAYVVDERSVFGQSDEYRDSVEPVELREDVVSAMCGADSWNLLVEDPYELRIGVTCFLILHHNAPKHDSKELRAMFMGAWWANEDSTCRERILEPGTSVYVRDLKSAPELNGLSGVVDYYIKSKCRYQVRLETQPPRTVGLRPECCPASAAPHMAAAFKRGEFELQSTIPGDDVPWLFSMARRGDQASVRFLLDQGCDLEQRLLRRDPKQWLQPDKTLSPELKTTPLLYVAMHGPSNSVRTLLEAKADFTAVNSLGQTAIDVAKEHRQVVSVAMLANVTAGRNPVADDMVTKSVLKPCLSSGKGRSEEARQEWNMTTGQVLLSIRQNDPHHPFAALRHSDTPTARVVTIANGGLTYEVTTTLQAGQEVTVDFNELVVASTDLADPTDGQETPEENRARWDSLFRVGPRDGGGEASGSSNS